MKYELTYIERQLQVIKESYPEYYKNILSGKELSDFILFLINNYSKKIDPKIIYKDSEEIISGDFFEKNKRNIIFNQLDEEELNTFKTSFEKHTEDVFMNTQYDISYSRQIRFMPAQWHYESYFIIYCPRDEKSTIYFKNGENVSIKSGEILILAPFVEHATPCDKDDQYLEYFQVRSSSFDKVFWEQLNSTTIMSHFFRNALKNEKDRSSYLLFNINNDKEIYELIEQIKKEIYLKENYSSQLINSLMSVLFCLLLRRYEDTVILPPVDNYKWKVEFTKIFSYIQNNYATTSLEEVAKICGYSSKQVGRIIKQYFNMSYTEMITFIKMDKAVSLLKENVLSMEEIADTLGYSDLPSFYRAFKKYYRETPINYKNNNLS